MGVMSENPEERSALQEELAARRASADAWKQSAELHQTVLAGLGGLAEQALGTYRKILEMSDEDVAPVPGAGGRGGNVKLQVLRLQLSTAAKVTQAR